MRKSSLSIVRAPAIESYAVLAVTPLFATLDDAALQEVAAQVDRVLLPAGEILMEEGEPGDCLYVVVSGRLGVTVASGNGETRVAELARGETVGEMALLTGARRSATVRAIRDAILLRFSKEAFDSLLERHPRTSMQLARLIVQRLEQSIHARVEAPAPPGTIAIAAAGANAPVPSLARALVRQLSRFGPALHLSSARLDDARTPIAGDDAELVAWLDAQEAAHAFVVYECDDSPTAWTKRCLRQADRVLLVARSGESTALSAVEDALLRGDQEATRASIELAIVHDASTERARNAADWKRDRRLVAHHHVRDGSLADAERLGRRLAGRALGLVLSGGGARGFAHLGVLRAFDECGVVIDAIGGNSMGAIVGGLYACGLPHDERVALCRRGFAENPPDGDYTLPMVALHAGKRGNRMLRTLYGDARIEDLWMDYFSVSTNLTRAEVSVAREGPMWRWVRASCSAPGMSPPLIDAGDLHVDGGILDNLPVGVMRRTIGIGRTIASDAGTARVLSGDASVDAVSGWDVLWNRMRRGGSATSLPGIAEILMRTATISSIPAGAEARRSADLYLQPPSDGVRITEWSGIDRAVEAGYEYALPVIEEWKNQSLR